MLRDLFLTLVACGTFAVGCVIFPRGESCWQERGEDCPAGRTALSCNRLNVLCSIGDGTDSMPTTDMRVRDGKTLHIETTLSAEATELSVAIDESSPDGGVAIDPLALSVTIDGVPAERLAGT